MEDVPTAEQVTIADPWEPFNRAMFNFNDRLYFGVLKPVAEAYRAVVPEPSRVSVGNFFSNLRSPIRFVNCLLQANVIGASTELFRFMLNSTIGLAGLFDAAGSEEIGLLRQDEDFGQTLGFYRDRPGVLHRLAVPRALEPQGHRGDGGGLLRLRDFLPRPLVCLATVRVYQATNDASLAIGDYEAIKEAAIDPYLAVRNAYVQYRQKKVEQKGSTVRTYQPDIPGAGTPARGAGREMLHAGSINVSNFGIARCAGTTGSL